MEPIRSPDGRPIGRGISGPKVPRPDDIPIFKAPGMEFRSGTAKDPVLVSDVIVGQCNYRLPLRAPSAKLRGSKQHTGNM